MENEELWSRLEFRFAFFASSAKSKRVPPVKANDMKREFLPLKRTARIDFRSPIRDLTVGEMTDGFRVLRGNGCPSFAVSEAQATFSFFGHSFSFTRERERIAPPEAPKC